MIVFLSPKHIRGFLSVDLDFVSTKTALCLRIFFIIELI